MDEHIILLNTGAAIRPCPRNLVHPIQYPSPRQRRQPSQRLWLSGCSVPGPAVVAQPRYEVHFAFEILPPFLLSEPALPLLLVQPGRGLPLVLSGPAGRFRALVACSDALRSSLLWKPCLGIRLSLLHSTPEQLKSQGSVPSGLALDVTERGRVPVSGLAQEVLMVGCV